MKRPFPNNVGDVIASTDNKTTIFTNAPIGGYKAEG